MEVTDSNHLAVDSLSWETLQNSVPVDDELSVDLLDHQLSVLSLHQLKNQ